MYTLLDNLDIDMVVSDRPLKFATMRELVEESNKRVEAYKAQGKRIRVVCKVPGSFYVIEEY